MAGAPESFFVVTSEGEESQLDTLFSFDSIETDKSYVVFTDNSKDDAGNVQVYVSVYDPQNVKTTEDGRTFLSLTPIETEEEWRMTQTLLDKLMEQFGTQE